MKKDNFLWRVKQHYWSFFYSAPIVELREWCVFLINYLPGKTGLMFRSHFYMPLKGVGIFGTGLKIQSDLQIDAPELLSVGSFVVINRGCFFNASGKISIGNNTLIGPGVKIWSMNHNTDLVLQNINSQGYVKKEVIIGENVWIAANAIILPGVIIGDGAIISAGAVVTKNVAPFDIVAGSPAKILRNRNEKNRD